MIPGFLHLNLASISVVVAKHGDSTIYEGELISVFVSIPFIKTYDELDELH